MPSAIHTQLKLCNFILLSLIFLVIVKANKLESY
jgi:hypothetical protein